eukprot:TRINITY_DN11889_c0_g1_i2.p1 TRINITY_DN11889_c0_g1~~TRINITY_DN11889_c0_g1_i2.p1  ORF type:complete len:252 (-),score=48.00 TRINITY_DN11889_c0_g1_i2:262-969(-)
MPAESSSPVKLSCPCADTFSYCDTFENKCVPCQDICQNQNSFADCQKDCPNYLQSVIFRHTVEKGDLRTLTIMVALTAAMTCVVMLAVFVLISIKLKKMKRLKKKIMPTSVFTIEKGKVEIDIPANDTVSDNLVIKGSASQIPSQMRPSLKPGTSMSTMVTQLSQESSINLPSTDTASTGITNSRNTSGRFGKQPRRLPSEDCIPEVGGRCNIAMSPVPGEERGRAYTAPHSQVV